MDRKAQELRRTLGDAPECLGRYRTDLEDCIDECAWCDVCHIYRDHCRECSVEPFAEREAMDTDAFYDLVFGMFTRAVAKGEVHGSYPMARRGWMRYFNALQEALDMEVFPNGELADYGDMYVKPWQGKNQHVALVYNVRVKLPGRLRTNPTLTRYHPNKLTRVQPVVELRCDPDTIFRRYPHAIELASRWRLSYMTTSPIGAVAINVLPDRIEDMARLNVRLLEDGLTRGLVLAGRKIRKVQKRKR